MIYKKIFILLLSFSMLSSSEFSITRLKYGGGGDWYSNPSSIPNLLKFIKNETNISVSLEEIRCNIGSSKFYNNPYYYITGHGNIIFTDKEREILRTVLTNGAFLHADDNYGMDKSFRIEIKKIFPEKKWIEIPSDHEIFNSFYIFDNGLPKIHEHDGKKPQALGIFHDDKLIILYTYESDLGDGWEDPEVHNHSLDLHYSALKMGTNIVMHYLKN